LTIPSDPRKRRFHSFPFSVSLRDEGKIKLLHNTIYRPLRLIIFFPSNSDLMTNFLRLPPIIRCHKIPSPHKSVMRFIPPRSSARPRNGTFPPVPAHSQPPQIQLNKHSGKLLSLDNSLCSCHKTSLSRSDDAVAIKINISGK
jgi:hypothetical protein